MSSTVGRASQWAKALERWIDEQNARAGQVTQVPVRRWEGPYSFPLTHTHVTDDLIARVAAALGDVNPLWTDADYAAQTRWHGIIGPPNTETIFSTGAAMPNPPQIAGWDSYQGGTLRNYHLPIRPGDVFRAQDTWHGVEEKSAAGKPYRLFVMRSQRAFINQDGEVACTITSRIPCTATAPDQPEARGPDHSSRIRRQYSEEELGQIQEEYERELAGVYHRGADPRYWQDVQVGDDLPVRTQGPYDISDALAYVGLTGNCPAFAKKWEQVRHDLGRRPVDPETGAPHHPIDWHFQDTMAQTVGLPYAHVCGTHIEMMTAHPVTDWMGDDAMLLEHDVQIRTVMFLGDVGVASAKVAAKRELDGSPVVDIDLALRTQDDVLVAKGRATVALPTRGED